VNPDVPPPLPLPEILGPDVKEAIKTLLDGSQPMSDEDIFMEMQRLFPDNEDLTLREIKKLLANDEDNFLFDWHGNWYRPLQPIRRPRGPAKWCSFVYSNAGRIKTNTLLQFDILEDLAESVLMIADVGDINTNMAQKDGPAEFIHFMNILRTKEEEYSLFKVTTKNLDIGALLTVVPKKYDGQFVYSSPCFYAETNVLNETLKSSISLLSVKVGRGAVITLVYVNSSNVDFLVIGTPWSIIGPYLQRVAELAPGMENIIFGDLNFDHPRTEEAWQSKLRDGLRNFPKVQVNYVTNAAFKQVDQVWLRDPENIMLYEVTRLPRLTKADHTAIEGEVKT
jgi:hypothetical protein